MKRILILALAFSFISFYGFAQGPQPNFQNNYEKNASEYRPHFGLKAGYNIASLVGSTPNFKPQSKNGFMAAAFYSRDSRSGLGYRTELVFSRQGFAFDEAGKKEDVTSDYLYMPHFTTFGIAKIVQFHLGVQIGYLLRSSKTNNASKEKPSDITELYNRLDYGAAGGLEIYPVKGLILGGRYNLSFGNLYKNMKMAMPQTPVPVPIHLPFNPSDIKDKNGVINFYIGYRF